MFPELNFSGDSGFFTNAWRDVLLLVGLGLGILQLTVSRPLGFRILALPFMLAFYLIQAVIQSGKWLWRHSNAIVRFVTATVAPPALVSAILMLSGANGFWLIVAVLLAGIHISIPGHLAFMAVIYWGPEDLVHFMDDIGAWNVMSGIGLLVSSLALFGLRYWSISPPTWVESTIATYCVSAVVIGLVLLLIGTYLTIRRRLAIARAAGR